MAVTVRELEQFYKKVGINLKVLYKNLENLLNNKYLIRELNDLKNDIEIFNQSFEDLINTFKNSDVNNVDDVDEYLDDLEEIIDRADKLWGNLGTLISDFESTKEYIKKEADRLA